MAGTEDTVMNRTALTYTFTELMEEKLLLTTMKMCLIGGLTVREKFNLKGKQKGGLKKISRGLPAKVASVKEPFRKRKLQLQNPMIL